MPLVSGNNKTEQHRNKAYRSVEIDLRNRNGHDISDSLLQSFFQTSQSKATLCASQNGRNQVTLTTIRCGCRGCCSCTVSSASLIQFAVRQYTIATCNMMQTRRKLGSMNLSCRHESVCDFRPIDCEKTDVCWFVVKESMKHKLNDVLR